jgi:hypothetical protein
MARGSAPFFLGVVAIGVILTAMFNAARGSLLVPFLFHAQMNGPVWPDAHPWDMWLFVAVAVVLVVINRRALLDRRQTVTTILMAGDEPVGDGAALLPATAVRDDSRPKVAVHRK